MRIFSKNKKVLDSPMDVMNRNILNEVEEGVIIGKTYHKRPLWFRVLVGIPLIYLPILFSMPFVVIGVLLVRMHLRALGAHNMKGYWDFVPTWVSHRYTHQTQIVHRSSPFSLGHYKWFWIFNCKMYCPMSIALLRYYVYLVKIVENWWCPFEHSRKHEYADASIDASYWHLEERTRALLDGKDRMNPIWNKDVRDTKA